MNGIGIIVTILSHIMAGLYMQKRKYNKVITACCWALYAAVAVGFICLGDNVVLGFFGMFITQFVIFSFTTVGTFGEKIFLFLTYANSFCILIGTNCLLVPFVNHNPYLQNGIVILLPALIHVFLYKVLLPTYRKSKVFFGNGWWKLNPVLILFLIQFLNQYAFSIVDKASARALFFDFIIFSSIFYLNLVILFDLVKGDAEKNKKAFENEELRNIAYVDILTGVPNRVAYTKYTDKQKRNHRRNMGSDFVLAMLDINGFKHINDTRGHAAGDEILEQAGKVLRQCAEASNCQCFRIGGDEFILLFKNAEWQYVEKQIEHLNEMLSDAVGITVSYGCAKVDFTVAKPFNEAFKKADTIMYSNKHHTES